MVGRAAGRPRATRGVRRVDDGAVWCDKSKGFAGIAQTSGVNLVSSDVEYGAIVGALKKKESSGRNYAIDHDRGRSIHSK